MRKLIYTVLILFLSNFSLASDNEKKQIDKLFNQLKKTTNYEESKKIESQIWDLWTTHPTDESLTNLLSDGSFYMSQNNLESAYETYKNY